MDASDAAGLEASLDAEDRRRLMDDMQEISAALARMAIETPAEGTPRQLAG